MKNLLVCADDYGMNEAVSRAILALADRSRLSATSAMVLSPHWPAHAAWLRERRGRLDVGLHLDWTSPFALESGHGMPLSALMCRAALRALDAQRVRQRIEQQLDLFENHWQAPPDHVDGHQHIQQFPVIREQLVDVLAARYPQGTGRPWLRISRPLHPGLDAKAWVIGAMGAAALRTLAAQAGLPHSDWLTGIYGFGSATPAYAERLSHWLAQAAQKAGVVLMCHPGMATSDTTDAISAARVREHEVLLGESWPVLLQAHGLQMARGLSCFAHTCNNDER